MVMRVEQPKHNRSEHNRSEKKDSSDSNSKTHKSVFSSTPSKTADITKKPTSGAFEKILEEARADSTKKKDVTANDNSTNAVTETAESEEEKDLDFRAEKREKSEEKNSENDGEQNGEDGSNHLTANIYAAEKKSAESPPPAARAILHVTDLERIIAYVRTQNLKDRQEVLIALKNSVLKGLEIKISLGENGDLKAQFLAKDEETRKQIKKRERELHEILKQRSPKFSEVSVLTEYIEKSEEKS